MSNPSIGRLELICGPMFSGKTTELIRRLEAAQFMQSVTLSFKPTFDTRYADQELVTHGGQRIRAVAAKNAADIERNSGDAKVVGIDEAHFFGSELSSACSTLVAAGVRVIVVGLEFDHRGDVFEPFPSLLMRSDEIIRLVGVCTVCGGEAIHSQRMIPNTQRIAVGGIGDYEPRCGECFKPSRL